MPVRVREKQDQEKGPQEKGQLPIAAEPWENLPVGVFRCDLEGRLTYVSGHAAAVWGQDAVAALLGKPCGLYWADGSVVPPEQTPMAVALRERRPVPAEEVIFKRGDGSLLFACLTADLVRDGAGAVGGTLSFFQCVSSDAESHNRVEEGHARLAAIVEHSDDAIISKDLNGIIRSWNRSAERLFGYSSQEAIGQSIVMLIPEGRHNEEPSILKRIADGQTIDHYETVRRRKDGSLLDISLTVSPIRNRRGQIIGASKIARDITARKSVEAAFRRSETLFRELADSMPQMVWVARPDGSIDYYNRRWYEFTGLPEGKFGQESWTAILHPDDAQRAVDSFFASIRSEQPYQIEFRLHDRSTGGYRWFLGRALPIRDESGKVIRWFGTCTDIDDQKRAEEKLERAVAERTASLREAVAQMEEFSYTVSHDLRAPLRGMQAYSEALLHDFAAVLPPEAGHYLQRIAANASRLDKMILDVLTFSRLARADIRMETVDLNPLVHRIIEQNPEMQSPRAEIEIEPLPLVLAHEASLTQALSNLLHNAVKFVAPTAKPHVRVWSERHPSGVRIYVRDNGIGISPQHQNRLFRMFERVHTDLKYEGTGVGLAIIRKAVERMGGRVGMESDGVHGSLFWLELRPAAV